MNTTAVSTDLPLSEPSSVVRPRREWSERMRKPATWLAVAALVPLWTALPASGNVSINMTADAVGLLAVLTAVLGRVWCAVYIAGRKNATLCQDGPYSLVRNPLYVFSFIGAAGIALASHRWGMVPFVCGVFLFYYHFVVKAEERRLADLFPRDYPAYCAAVPRGLPRLSGYHSRAQLTLDPRDVTRAMREVVWFPLAFLAVAALARLA